jgi:alkylation response protein AidB-like acyl-CoA dehydrogenase
MSTRAETMTKEELIGRAEQLVPVVAQRASAAEQLRRVPDETIADLRDAGLLRVGTPERFGGYAVDFDAIWEIGFRLGQGCGSTGWVYMVTQVHSYQAGLAPAEAQQAFFFEPDMMSSSAFAPTGTVTPVDGGWTLHGDWPFSSGADHAAWFLLGGLVPGRGLVLSMVPRDQAEIVDDWHVSGLRATGSKTIRIQEPVFVAEHHWLPVNGDGDAAARDLHGRDSYAAPLTSIAPFTLVAPLVGIAHAAVDIFAQQAQRRRMRGVPVRDMEATQLRIAESAAEVDAALTIARARIAEHAARGVAGAPPLTVEERLRYRLNHAQIAGLCVSAVNRLFDAAGGSALYDRNPMQRLHRDVHAGAHQVALNWDDVAPLYGRLKVGLEPGGVMW